MASSSRLEIHFPQGTRSIAVPPSKQRFLLTELLRQAELPLNTRCGQHGQCDGCMIELLAGTFRHAESGELVQAGDLPRQVRGCQHVLSRGSDAKILIPPRSLLAHEPQVVTFFRLNVPRAHDPLWQRVEVPQAELATDIPLAEALCRALAQRHERARVLCADTSWNDASLAGGANAVATLQYRGNDWLVSPPSAHRDGGSYGAAVDIGTTTVVVLLVDLETGEIVSTASALNAQTNLGDNVLTRISRCMNDKKMVQELQDVVLKGTLAPLLDQVLEQAHASAGQLMCLTLVGNTTMLHLAAGVDPSSMGLAPFTPTFLQHRTMPGRSLPWCDPASVAAEPKRGDQGSICNEDPQLCSEKSSGAVAEGSVARGGLDATVHLLPGAAAYIGADITAGMLSSGLAYRSDTCMLVDVGTNGEITLKHGDQLLGCATAAGPAFEGAGLKCGMRAGDGAIGHVRLEGDPAQPEIDVIGGGKPVGICGTAYVDFLAEARRVGLLGPAGRRAPETLHDRWIREDGYGHAFVVAFGRGKEPVVISEADIASLLQAKAAIAAGILCLLKRAGLQSEDVSTLFLAGGFGFHMNIDSVIGCGLLPGFRPPQIQLVGNTALAGAYLALLDSGALEEIKHISAKLETIELNLDPHFESCYIDQLSLPG